jgi:hypothetical protein
LGMVVAVAAMVLAQRWIFWCCGVARWVRFSSDNNQPSVRWACIWLARIMLACVWLARIRLAEITGMQSAGYKLVSDESNIAEPTASSSEGTKIPDTNNVKKST